MTLPGDAASRRRGLPLAAACAALLAAATAAATSPIAVEIDEAYPPNQFADARGRPRGFDVDLFRAVAEAAGIAYELRLASWPTIREHLETGAIDLNPGVFRTATREEAFEFTIPTLRTYHAIFVRNDSTVASLQDLEGRPVLINRGGYHDDLIREQNLPVEPITTETPKEALLRLASGEGDAAILLQTQGVYFIRELGLENVRSLPVRLRELELRFAVAPDRPDLLAAMNDGLARVRESPEYDRIYDRWFGVLKPQGVPAGRVLLVLGAGLLALLAVGAGSLLWSRSLQRQVDLRTRQLTESDARLRATLAAARDVGFVVAETPGDEARILEFSDGAERMFGRGRGETLGRPIGSLRSEDDRRRHDDLLGARTEEGGRSREAELLRGSGEPFVAFVVATLLPHGPEERARLLYVVFDLSERVRAEEQRRALERRLYEAEKMEALGRLAGGVAHDFNNLLTLILGNAQLLRGGSEPESDARARLDEIQDAGRSAGELIRQLLTFGRRQPARPKPITWNGVIEGMAAVLRSALPERIALDLRLGEATWSMEMDPSQAQQVVVNLVLNARDAIGDRGRIVVTTAYRTEAGGEFASLEVQDDGRGIDAATRPHIFEPFFTTKDEQRGTGLGLATVHGIVQQTGGRIEVESEPGVGSRFLVLVPRRV